MTEFTPFSALFGGALIGAAAVLLLATNGRVAGICGIYSDIFPPWTAAMDISWRLAFVVGLVVAPALYLVASGGLPALVLASNPVLLAVSGLLVGAGATVGNGCTSGHGVCGLARISPRSLVAVPTFMVTAAATVFTVRHLIGS